MKSKRKNDLPVYLGLALSIGLGLFFAVNLVVTTATATVRHHALTVATRHAMLRRECKIGLEYDYCN